MNNINLLLTVMLLALCLTCAAEAGLEGLDLRMQLPQVFPLSMARPPWLIPVWNLPPMTN
jgi:hypothetical protein